MNQTPFSNKNNPLTQAPPLVGVCGVRSAADYAKLVALADTYLCANYIMSAGIKDIIGDVPTIKTSQSVRVFVHCDFQDSQAYADIVHSRFAATSDIISGAQLNLLPWMDADFAPTLTAIKHKYKHVTLMLQAHSDIMARYSPQDIAARVAQLPVDYILFDASQSRGRPYVVRAMQAYVAAVYNQAPHVRVVVAGGLGPHVMDTQFAPLAKRFAGLGCDAFLRITDAQSGQLSFAAVEQYLAGWRNAVTKSNALANISVVK